MLRRLFLLLALGSLTLAIGAAAQNADPDIDRDRYVREIRNYKHKYLARQLELSHERQAEFFRLYDAMEDEIMELNIQTRELEQRVDSDTGATEVELEAASAALFSQKAKEAEIESRYYDRFKQCLTPRQLFRLKGAERGFNKQMVRQHRQMRSSRARHSGR